VTGRPELGQAWEQIPGWESYYDISDHGLVWSVRRCVTYKDGHTRIVPGGLRATPLASGYKSVYLHRNGTISGKQLVHALVLQAFVGPRPVGMQACHMDGNRLNNFVGNLRWDTVSNNALDQVAHGRHRHKRRTHCPLDHALVGPNLVAGEVKRGRRGCRSCACGRSRGRSRPGVPLKVLADQVYAELMEAVR
jgi:hypothetical protein